MGSSKKGGTRGTLFRKLADMRLRDAEVLLSNKRFHGALYLAGYSVECALKWAITQHEEGIYLPADLEVHDLQKLMGRSGLAQDLQRDMAISPLFSALVDDWGPQERYAASKLDGKTALRLYKQTNQVYKWILERAI